MAAGANLDRRLWPTFSSRIMGQALAKADAQVMWHTEIDYWGRYWESRNESDLADFKIKGWQNATFAETDGDADQVEAYAYDAVWAMAIGLAAARQAGEMGKVAEFSRSGGSKGPFRGVRMRARNDRQRGMLLAKC